MRQATSKLYIRFGDIPPTKKSRVYVSGEPIGEEAGLSVYKAVEANGRFFPVLPDDSNEAGISDYFRYLMESDSKVFLVTGDLLWLEGHDREPLIANPVVISDITTYYRNIKEQSEGGAENERTDNN